MALLNDGRDQLTSLAIGSGTAYDNANALLYVGTSSATPTSSQTGLQGSSTVSKSMNSGYPIVDPEGIGDDNKLRFRATFESSEANFIWSEWGISNGIDFLNRETDNIGEKSSTMTWVFEVDISLQVST